MAFPYAYNKFTTSRGLTYSYIHLLPTSSQKPTLLFLHGFPSSSHDWKHQIAYFSQKGYGIIVPDMLGYGGTSKPLDVMMYKGKDMAQDIVDILAHEKLEKVVGVAHDWGSLVLSRIANYHPEVLIKLAYLDVGYSAPGSVLSYEQVRFVNKMVKEKAGFELFGYFLFLGEEDAVELLNKNSDSLFSLMFSEDEEVSKKYMGATGGLRQWLEEGKIADAPSYLTAEDRAFNATFYSPENGGFAAPVNWYRASLQNINKEDDESLPKEALTIHQPTLLIAGGNFITKSADFPGTMKPVFPSLVVKETEAGHWIMLEVPEKTNELLGEFIEG